MVSRQEPALNRGDRALLSVLLARRELFPYLADRIRKSDWARRLDNTECIQQIQDLEKAVPCSFSFLSDASFVPWYVSSFSQPLQAPACSFSAHGSWKNYACRETTSFL